MGHGTTSTGVGALPQLRSHVTRSSAPPGRRGAFEPAPPAPRHAGPAPRRAGPGPRLMPGPAGRRARGAMPTTRDVQAKREVFFRYLTWLLSDSLPQLQAHVERNASIEWFRNRISFPLETCAIVSTSWLFAKYSEWKEDVAGQLPLATLEALHYSHNSGEQKSFTLFVRHVLLGRMGMQTERIKGQDTLEGTSEYFLVIKGGLQSLHRAMELVSAYTNGA